MTRHLVTLRVIVTPTVYLRLFRIHLLAFRAHGRKVISSTCGSKFMNFVFLTILCISFKCLFRGITRDFEALRGISRAHVTSFLRLLLPPPFRISAYVKPRFWRSGTRVAHHFWRSGTRFWRSGTRVAHHFWRSGTHVAHHFWRSGTHVAHHFWRSGTRFWISRP